MKTYKFEIGSPDLSLNKDYVKGIKAENEYSAFMELLKRMPMIRISSYTLLNPDTQKEPKLISMLSTVTNDKGNIKVEMMKFDFSFQAMKDFDKVEDKKWKWLTQK